MDNLNFGSMDDDLFRKDFFAKSIHLGLHFYEI